MHAAMKRLANADDMKYKDYFLESLGEQWALSIGGENRLRLENEIEDTEFRLKRGSDLGRFDQFWDDDILFQCRYSRSKWLDLRKRSTVPLEIYSHALKRNKSIIHIAFDDMASDFEVNQFLCDLPWVTSISPGQSVIIPAVPRDLLFIHRSEEHRLKSTRML